MDGTTADNAEGTELTTDNADDTDKTGKTKDGEATTEVKRSRKDAKTPRREPKKTEDGDLTTDDADDTDKTKNAKRQSEDPKGIFDFFASWRLGVSIVFYFFLSVLSV